MLMRGMVVLAAALLLAVGAVGVRAAEEDFYAGAIGIIYRDDLNRHILAITNPDLKKGDSVAVVRVPGEAMVCCATVSEKLDAEPESLWSIQLDGPASFYVLKGKRIRSVHYAFGVRVPEDRFSKGAGTEADLDGDGRKERFRSCTSQEGMHLTAWSGKPLEGDRRWHGYVGLGYAVDPTCDEKDY